MSMAVIAVTSAVTVGATAYSAKQARKAQRKAREDQRFRELIEGSAPNISNVQEVAPEEVMGSEVAGLEEALKAMDYQGGQPPVPGQDAAMGAMPADLSEEDLAMLMQSGGLEGLLPQMADGGPVGTPNDVYYFGVPQIMGMMQDPDPQIQQVGMQLAGQMEAMPDAGMVPATQDQIRGMAYGGAVEPKKLEMGGSPEYNPELDLDFILQQEALEELLELDQLVDQGVISEARAEYDRQRLSGQAFPRESQPGRMLSDRDRKNIKEMSRKRLAEGGPITEDRLNQLRLR